VPVIDRVVESGRVPEGVLRAGIRTSCRTRLLLERTRTAEDRADFVAARRTGPLAVRADAANRQHYEVPAAFFEAVLGPRLKYSSGLWSAGVTTLADAEEAMLAVTCARAGLVDGMDILELGCGWGSLTTWMAEQYPSSRIVALSNSVPQRAHIEGRGLANVEVLTADITDWSTTRTFDRVVSVEMFEHLRNYGLLFERIASWLRDDGRLFAHVFSHRADAYTYDHGWMSRQFFTGGTMPSHDLFAAFSDHLVRERRWIEDGTHYARTAEAWKDNLDRQAHALRPVLAATYGPGNEDAWIANWRVFFLACAELFGYRNGQEWGVSHHLFRKA